MRHRSSAVNVMASPLTAAEMPPRCPSAMPPCDGQADAEAVPAGAGGVGPIEPVKQPGGVDVSGVLAPVGHGERLAPAQHGPDAAYS